MQGRATVLERTEASTLDLVSHEEGAHVEELLTSTFTTRMSTTASRNIRRENRSQSSRTGVDLAEELHELLVRKNTPIEP